MWLSPLQAMAFVLVCWLAAAVVGCGGGQPQSDGGYSALGNGFFLGSEGMTIELHPAVVTLHRDSGGGRMVKIWPAVRAGGGPFVLERGLVFSGWDGKGIARIFHADPQGRVSDVTGCFQPPGKTGQVVDSMERVDGFIELSQYDARGQLSGSRVLPADLEKYAAETVAHGEKAMAQGYAYHVPR